MSKEETTNSEQTALGQADRKFWKKNALASSIDLARLKIRGTPPLPHD